MTSKIEVNGNTMNKEELREKLINNLGCKYVGDRDLTTEELDNGYENIHTLELTLEDLI